MTFKTQAYCWIFIFLCVLYSSDTQASDRFSKADSLFTIGEFQSSAIAYEQIYFFGDSAETRARANLGRARSLRELKRYDHAHEALDRIRLRVVSEELHFQIRQERMLLFYISGNYTGVISEYGQLSFFLGNFPNREKTTYLNILALNELGRWDEAYNLVKSHYKNQELAEIEALYSELPSFKNESTAGWLATFIPGSGQIYAGATGEGLVSGGLQLASLGWMGYNFWKGYYVTGLLTGGGLFQTTYFASIERAQTIAEESNSRFSNSFNEELKQEILRLEELRRNQQR